MNIRHGDLALIGIDKLPEGLTSTSTNVLMAGSGGNNHTCVNGTVYFKDIDRFVFGYLSASHACKLLHPDHGKKLKNKALKEIDVPTGVYELRRQFEETHKGMKQVID